MKDTYPFYKKSNGKSHTEISEIVKSMNQKEKDFFDNAIKKVYGTSNETRQVKIKTYVLQMMDILEKDLSKLSIKDIEDIKDFYRLVNKHKKRWSRNDIIKITKKFLKRNYKALWKRLEEDDEFLEITKGQSQKKCVNKERVNKQSLPTKEEIEILIKNCKTLRDILLMIMVVYSACRPHELVKIKFKDVEVDEKNQILKLSVYADKTQESRTIPLKEPYAHFIQWKEQYWFSDVSDDDYIFPKKENRYECLRPYYLTQFIYKLCDRCGIRKINAYMFRHRLLSQLQKKLKPALYEKFAGHKYQLGIDIYGHLDSSDLEEAMLEEVYTDKVLPKEEKDRLNLKIYDQGKEIGELKNNYQELKDEFKKQIGELWERETGDKIVDIEIEHEGGKK